jgi:serine/threonine protein kinase/Tfp pilus assembly protein PilF
MMEAENGKTQTHIVLIKGTAVGHYRIVEKIGAGGMGEVYLAEDTELHRRVALKFLPPHLCKDDDCRKRFRREAQAAAGLNHPNIVTIYEVGDHQGRPYFAMEYVEGRSLKEHIQQGDIITERIINGAIQICDGLQIAHTAGIIHRDIKPSNIILDLSRRPRILDFGLAAVSGAEQLTKTGSTMGTVGYMSPEQVACGEIDHRSDLFSIGVVLYELFASRPPFKGETEAATLQAILHDTPEPLARYKSGISDDLQRVITKLLEKDPDLRYQSAAGLISDLKKIAQGRSDISAISHVAAPEVRPSIAVLPFTNLSADPEQEYFCDGMAEEIINALTHLENLRVIARTSAFAFKGKNEDMREIGRKLDVGTLLEGSVRKAGNRLRITAQLIKVTDGSHLWSERYDRELEDVFAIQDEISLAIADKLKLELLQEKKEKIIRPQTEDLDAYNLYLKGRYFAAKRTEEDLCKSIEYFKQATAKDPNYALAYAELGYSYALLADNGDYSLTEAASKAQAVVLKALKIDDSLPEAYACLGMVRTYLDWDWEGAEVAYQRAITLNPASTMAHYLYAFHLTLLARYDDSAIEFQRALETDPLSLINNRNYGMFFLYAGRFDEAIETLHRALEMDPNFPAIHWGIGEVYYCKSMYTEALAEFQKEIEIHRMSDSIPKTWIGITYAAMGEKNKAQEILDEINRQKKGVRNKQFFVATLHFALGDKDQGFESLAKATA